MQARELLKLERSSFRDLRKRVLDLERENKDLQKLSLARAVLERRTFQLTRRLVCRASRAVNFDLQPWILRNLKPFSEDNVKEKRRDSGTMEQYKVFMEYQEKLEKLLDEFASDEGFDNVQECYEVIQKAVKKDRVLNEKHMKEIEKVVRRLETEHASNLLEDEQENVDEGKYSDGDDDAPVDVDSILTKIVDGDDEEEEEEKKIIRKPNPKRKPQIIVFQPMSCDILIKSLLQIADYETFSNMMKRKAQHINHMRRVENDIRTFCLLFESVYFFLSLSL